MDVLHSVCHIDEIKVQFFEGGIMEEFFEAGHIIFNAGIKNVSYLQDYPITLAREEGAYYLLEVVLECIDDGEKEGSCVKAAEYMFIKVEGPLTISKGVLSPNEKQEMEADPEGISYLLGKDVALKSLSSM